MVIILTCLTTAFASLLPLASKIIIDFVILKGELHKIEGILQSLHLDALIAPARYILGSVETVICLILVIGLIVGSIEIIKNFISIKFQQEVTFNIQTELFDHLLRFPMSYFKDRQVGYLMSRVSNDVYQLQMFFSHIIPQLTTNVLYVLFSFGIIITLNNKMTYIILGVLPVWWMINYFFGSRVRAVSMKAMEKHAQLSKDMQETFSGVEVIK